MHSRFDTESRIAVTQAADIARELGHQEIGPGHLLLGLLANPRGTAYAALRDHGIDLETARDLVAEHHVEAAPTTDEPGERDATQARDYAEDREALKAIGIDLDRVRDAVRENLGADLADGWASRSERGRPRGDRRRRRHRHHHGHDHHDNHDRHEGRGRRGPRSRRDDGPRWSRELRALMHDVRRATMRDRLDAESREDAHRVPGMSGARLLVALTRCDDPAVQAVLALATGIEGLRAQAEAATKPIATD
jgi:hypothetical protein